MAKRKQKRNKKTNSSLETSSGCDTSIDVTSSSEVEDWSGMDPDHDWEFKVVGVEIEAVRGEEIHETRWPTWSRTDGTTNTWERIKNNPHSVLETSQWDQARKRKVRLLRKQVKRDLGLSKTKKNLTSFPLSPSLSIPISSSLDLISTPTRNHAEFINEKMALAEKLRQLKLGRSGMAHMAKKLQKEELEKRRDILVSELGFEKATELIKALEEDTDDDEMDLEERDDGFEEKSEDGEERGERDEEMEDPDTNNDRQGYRRRSVDDNRSALLSQKQISTASARQVALIRGARKSVQTRAASRSTSTAASATSSSSYASSGTIASTSSAGAHTSIDDVGKTSPTASMDTDTEWSCFMCTFKNLPRAIKCIMCDRPNAQLARVAQAAQSPPVTAPAPSPSSSNLIAPRTAPTKPLSTASMMSTTSLSASSTVSTLTTAPWIPPSKPTLPSSMPPRPSIPNPYLPTAALNRVNVPTSFNMSSSTPLHSSSSSSDVPSISSPPSMPNTFPTSSSSAPNTPNIKSLNIYLANQVQSRTDSSSSSGSALKLDQMKKTSNGTSATSTSQTDPVNLPRDISDFTNGSIRDVDRNASSSGAGQGPSQNVTRQIKPLPQRNSSAEKPRGPSSGSLGHERTSKGRSVSGSGSAAASGSSSTATTISKSKTKFGESKSSNYATPTSNVRPKSPISTASNSTTTTTIHGSSASRSTVTLSTTSTLRPSSDTEMGTTKTGMWKGKAKETRSNLDLLTLTWTAAAIQAGAAPVTFVNQVDDEDGPPGIRVDFRFLEKLEVLNRSPNNDTSPSHQFQRDSHFGHGNDGFRYLESQRLTRLPQLREPLDSGMFLRCTCESHAAKQEDLDGDVAMLFDDSESDTRSHSSSRRSSSRISHMDTKVKIDAKGKGKSTYTKTHLTCGISSHCGCQEVSELRDKAGRPMRAYTKEGLFVHTSRYNPLSSGIEIIECNQYCHCAPPDGSFYSSCINRVAQKPRRIPIEVFKTEERGWGVRCFEQDLRTGMVLGCYTGELIHRSTAAKLLGEDKTYVFDLDGKDPPIDEVREDENRRGENGFDIDEEDLDPNVQMYSIDARKCGNWTRFLNHSCHPNLAVYTAVWDTIPEQNIPHLVFFALDDIPRGEEMTVDYHAGRPLPKPEKTKTKGKRKNAPEGSKGATSETGDGERDRPWGTRECFCGSRRCRGWV